MAEQAGEVWIWVSFAPEYRLVLATHVGGHEEEDADEVVKQTKGRLSRPLPLFVSDGWDAYVKTLLKAFHRLVEVPRTGRRGRPRMPIMEPDPELRYAQVVKIRERNRVVKVEKRMIFGDPQDIDMEHVSTSLLERLNLSIRQENGRLNRKTLRFSKMLYRLRHQVTFYGAYVNWVRVHRGLRQQTNECVNGKIFRKWRYRTPAMAAGLSDHVWTLRELCTNKVLFSSTN